MTTAKSVPILHIYTYKLRDSLSRLGYNKPNTLLFRDSDRLGTNGVCVFLPRNFHGHLLDAQKPTKKARLIASSMIHQTALQLAYRACKELRKAAIETNVDSRLINLTMRVHAENMTRTFWPKKLDRKADRFAKVIERKAVMPKLLETLEAARADGNQREINYTMLAICHIARANNPFTLSKEIRNNKTGKVYQVISTPEELTLAKQFATLRHTGENKMRIADLAIFIRNLPTLTENANAGSRVLITQSQAESNGYADLYAASLEENLDPDYGLDDFRTSVILFEVSKQFATSDFTGGGYGYGNQMDEISNEDNASTFESGDADAIEVSMEFESLLDRMVDDALTMQYKKSYIENRGRPLSSAIQMAKNISIQLNNSDKVTRVTGVVDKLNIESAITSPKKDESIFYMERTINEPEHKRSVVIAVDISYSMAGKSICLAMTAAQAIALSLRATGGYCGGVLFNALGFADPDLTDSPLFRQDPFGVTGDTSFQFMSEIWARTAKRGSIVIVITDGSGDLPFVIQEEDRERTYIITLNKGMITQLEALGKVHELQRLADLPQVITNLIV